jgi:hypothetical protein
MPIINKITPTPNEINPPINPVKLLISNFPLSLRNVKIPKKIYSDVLFADLSVFVIIIFYSPVLFSFIVEKEVF